MGKLGRKAYAISIQQQFNSDVQIKITKGNCDLLRAVPILYVTKSMKIFTRVQVSDEIIPETPLIARTDTEEDANLFPCLLKIIGSSNANMLLEKVAEFNAEHLKKALPKIINCQDCLNACYKDDQDDNGSQSSKFYDDWSIRKCNENGIFPSEDVVKICVALENYDFIYNKQKFCKNPSKQLTV